MSGSYWPSEQRQSAEQLQRWRDKEEKEKLKVIPDEKKTLIQKILGR